MPGEVLIDMRNVCVHADDGHLILDGVTLQVRRGEVFGLVFGHGGGKSTLLRAAAGFFKPDQGEVLFRGRRFIDLAFEEEAGVHSKIGFVFQNGGLLVNSPVFDNVALPLRYHTSLPEEEIEKRVTTALADVDMAYAARKFPWELSVARQKLVAVARALVREPEIVLFDNFVTGTDLRVWEVMNRIVRQTRANRNLSWMLVLEADPGVTSIADRLAVIEDGRILATNAPEMIKTSEDARVSRVFKVADFNEDTWK